MVDYFDAAGISQSGNTITVKGANVNKPNDQLVMSVAAGTFAYISQNFSSTLTSGDAISGTANYKTFSNGLTAFNDGQLDLPVKKMKLMIVEYELCQKTSINKFQYLYTITLDISGRFCFGLQCLSVVLRSEITIQLQANGIQWIPHRDYSGTGAGSKFPDPGFS